MRYLTKEILLTLLIILTFGHIYSQVQDSLYVWANPGLNIRKTIDPNSEIISFISFGEKILPDWSESSDNINLRIKESAFVENKKTPELFLKGRMVKVKYKNQIGFVFSGFLSHFPVFPNDMSFLDFLITEFDTIKTIRYKSSYYSDQKIFENGIISFSYNECSGCSETTYIIPDISLQEGFLIAYHLFRLGDISKNSNNYYFWYPRKIEENYIEISGSLDLDFFISVRKSYSFTTLIIGSYN